MTFSIVAEGGSLRGAFPAGVMLGLDEIYGLARADILAGASASAGTMAYAAAGQTREGKIIWTEKLAHPNFLSKRNLLRGNPFLNLHYLVYVIFQKLVPLDEERLRQSPTDFWTPLTNAVTGEPEYFGNRSKARIHPVLYGAMNLPGGNFLTQRGLAKIGEQYYFDGGASDPLPLNAPGVKESDRKIIILTRTETKEDGMGCYRIFLKAMQPFFPEGVRRAMAYCRQRYEERLEQVREAEREGHLVIRPNRTLPPFDNRRKTLEGMVQEGCEAGRDPKVRDFILALREEHPEYFKN